MARPAKYYLLTLVFPPCSGIGTPNRADDNVGFANDVVPLAKLGKRRRQAREFRWELL
jgi:hypothetical protein